MAEISFVEVVDVGPGWNKVRASDGNVYTLKGNYNWRSNNPGNIEYGDFAKSMGAIGSGKPPAGRKRGFAIFPTYEAGMKAQEKLQFESPRYRDLSIRDAISRYAPEFENDSAAYAAQLAAAAGVTTDTKLSDLTPQQRHAYLQAQHRVEGFVPGRISGEDGKPVPASVARQFAAIPLPPKDIPSTSSDVGEGASFDMLSRFGNPGAPADPSAPIRVARATDDAGIGTAFSQLERFGQIGAAPVTMSDELGYSSGRLQDIPVPARRPVGPLANVPMPRARPSLPTPIADAANITPMTFPPSPMASLSRGIVDSAQSPKLFAEGVGIPNEHIPGTDATYSGANRMSTGGLGALLGRSFSPATPNPTPWQPTVAGRPSVPGSLPAARPQSTITGRPDAPVGSMPAKRASAPVPAPWGQRPGSSAQAGPMETSSVRPLATQPTSNPSFAAPLPPKYITKTVQTANPDYRQVNPGNPTLAAMGFSPGTMPASAQVPQYLTKTVKAPNPAYQSALLARQRALRAAPVPATQSAAMAASRVPAPMDTGLFGVPMSSGMKTALATPSKSSGSSSSSSSKSVPAGYKDLGGGKFQSASGGIYYTRHL